ncbi:hypothetical protein DSN97_05230 [Deferribacteraceae bacterium V6Fe1]|nr:hypothetical protein DSN97_05230 [Deferribacteraceae bacterium V6Fe1]
MKKLLGVVFLIVIFASIVAFAQFGSSEKGKIVAVFDGNEIKVSDLTNYVDTLLGEKYKKMLETEDGIKQIADYYITRQIILDYAKENIKGDDKLLKSHSNGNMDKDTMLITAVIKKEVQDKIVIEKDELEKFMKESDIKDRTAALARLEAKKRAELFNKFIAELKGKHSIKFM